MKILLTALMTLLASTALASAPFTFQGAIDNGGTPLDGSADLSFTVHDQASGGNLLAGPLPFTNHPVDDGLFSVILDFPGLLFDGSPRFVEISVDGQTLSPRIELQAAPLAGSALALRGRAVDSAAPQVGDALVWDGSAWAPDAVGGGFSAGTGLNLAGSTFSVAPDYRLPQGCAGDQIARWNGSQWSCSDDQDQDTQYTAGNGLSLVGQTFEVDFAGSGANDAAARSDHGHYGDFFMGDQNSRGLVIINQSDSLQAVGLYAQSNSTDRGIGVHGRAIELTGTGVLGSGDTGVEGYGGSTGIFGRATASHGASIKARSEVIAGRAFEGEAAAEDGFGLHVTNTSPSGLAYAAFAQTSSAEGVAILGDAPGGPSGSAIGVRGQTAGPFSFGMFATNTATTGPATALRAVNTAVGGTATSFSSLGAGASRAVEASSSGVAAGASAVRASLTDLGSNGDAVYAFSQSSSGNAGRFVNNSGTAIALAGGATAFEATGNGVISGDLGVFGTLSAAAKFFRIDHPLDPEQRFLQHAAIESDRFLTLYSGNVVTDASGQAEVVLPEWFEALNRDFRYQLTVIGSFARAIIGEEIDNGRFLIRTDAPAVKVSWQVTAERRDAWAEANPLIVEPSRDSIDAPTMTGER